MTDVVCMELFNSESRFLKYTTREKLQIVNAIFRFLAFSLFILFYVIQTAVCCLVYGVLPGSNVKYVLVQMVLIDLVCICAQYVNVQFTVLRRVYGMVLGGQQKRQALVLGLREGVVWADFVRLMQVRRTWVNFALLYFTTIAQYDTLNVIHCAFIHACAMGFATTKKFVAALGMMGMSKHLINDRLLPVISKAEPVISLANRILQGLILVKLVLAQSASLMLLIYILLLPLTLDFYRVDLGLALV